MALPRKAAPQPGRSDSGEQSFPETLIAHGPDKELFAFIFRFRGLRLHGQGNSQCHAAVAALRADDATAFGRILSAGHASLRDDYEVSAAPVDRLAAIAAHDPDVLGARLTGGGFGGAVVMAVRRHCAAAAAARVAAAYGREFAGGRVLVPVAPPSREGAA